MTFARLLLRNLVYHWRGNLAVLLGVVVGAAVLTGALLVGDSLRGSLEELALARLGWVEHALVPGRFFREGLAGELGAGRVSPVLLLQGSASARHDHESGPTFANQSKAVLLGVDERFWPAEQLPVGRDFWHPPPAVNARGRRIVVGAALARDLGLTAGDVVAFHVQKAGGAPRETVLGRRKAGDVVADLVLTVAAVLPDEHFGSRFSLAPGSAEPRNAFVPLVVLQEELRRQERTLPERPVNALLVGGGEPGDLQGRLRQHLQLEDYGLVLRVPRGRPRAPAPGYVSLESRQLFLDESTLKAARAAKGLRVAPTLVYLVNNIARAKQQVDTAAALLAPPGAAALTRPAVAYDGSLGAPYAVVAALNPGQMPPLGRFLPPGMRRLADDQILLVKWEGSPLEGSKPGDVLSLTYFEPQEEGQLREHTAAFRLAAVIPLEGAADDRNLTPQFPGVTDKLSMADWDPPFPFDRKRIGKADEAFWVAHRATPKAYITLRAGKKLWASRFGQYTSLRIVPPDGPLPPKATEQVRERARKQVEARLLAHLDPEAAGLVFRDVRSRGLEASAGSSDFGQLFLLFSLFLIAAALLLVGLLFRLNLDRRAAEVGVLLATGYRRGKVRLLLLLEGGALALVGAALGCAAAVLFAGLMLALLGALWPGGLGRSFLRLHPTPTSFVIGYAASVAVSVLTIFWATRVLSRVAPSALLAGSTVAAPPEGPGRRRPLWSFWVAGLSAVGAALCLAAGATSDDHEMKASGFFFGGFLLLAALLALVWAWLRGGRRHAGAAVSLAALGVRNAGRHPLRSLLTVGLLGAAVFVVVAVQAFHRDVGADFLGKDGGSGGFPLLAESDLPIYQDLNSPRGREELDLPAPAVAALRGANVYALRQSAGDDASCLNLYRPLQPRLVGVPASLIERGGFRFADAEVTTDEEWANPWLLLRKRRADGAVPVFGEATTVTWVLKSGLGKELTVKDEQGAPVRLRIVGLLEDSVFQSELVTSEANFLSLYPRQEGYRMFLIETAPDEAPKVKAALEPALADFGFTVTPAAERLASYLAVENTYLATFQALGGLGLLLGALGLAVVLLRSVWERRGELALLRAVGFRRSALAWLVLAENACLLALGLAVGTAAALLAVAPHLSGGVGAALGLRLLALLGLVLFVGLAAGAAAVVGTLRAPLLPALRAE
jgi:ABC-type antimicrobial peptide transport system permease subunit